MPFNIPARYQVLSQLGTSGTGIVYKVQDLETGEIVALKVLKPGIASEQDMQEHLRKRFVWPARSPIRMSARIHEFNRSHGTACLSMEFVEGRNSLIPDTSRGPP